MRRRLAGLATFAATTLAVAAPALAVAAAAAAAIALVAAAPPSRAEVRRLDPRSVTLRTHMSLRSTFYLYLPPAPAAPPGATAPKPPAAAPAGAPGAATTAIPPASMKTPVILISGEAGWRPLQQDTASLLAAEGRAVLAIDATAFFGKRLGPDEWSADFDAIRACLNEQVGRPADSPVIFGGFYFGADMVPYILNRAGAEGVLGVLLIGPTREGAEIYRVGYVLKLPTPTGEEFDVATEIRRMPPRPTALIQGALDQEGAAGDFVLLLNGQRKYFPIMGADRLFREGRDLYMTRVSEALTWMEDLQSSLPAAPAPPPRPPVLHSPVRPATPPGQPSPP